MNIVFGLEARKAIANSNAYTFDRDKNKCGLCGSKLFYQPQKRNVVCMLCHPATRKSIQILFYL